jgi:hypothetical protein
MGMAAGKYLFANWYGSWDLRFDPHCHWAVLERVVDPRRRGRSDDLKANLADGPAVALALMAGRVLAEEPQTQDFKWLGESYQDARDA